MGAVYLTGMEILRRAAQILDGRKAEDVKAIDIAGVSILADYFLLASGGSSTQVRSLAEELEFKLSEAGAAAQRVEGMQSASWVVLDYGSVVVHVFHRDTRSFYNLERLWADGRVIGLAELLGSKPEEEPRKAELRAAGAD